MGLREPHCFGWASGLASDMINKAVAGSMNVENEITGQRLRLRLVTPEDAAFIHGLRIDLINYRIRSFVAETAASRGTRFLTDPDFRNDGRGRAAS